MWEDECGANDADGFFKAGVCGRGWIEMLQKTNLAPTVKTSHLVKVVRKGCLEDPVTDNESSTHGKKPATWPK